MATALLLLRLGLDMVVPTVATIVNFGGVDRASATSGAVFR